MKKRRKVTRSEVVRNRMLIFLGLAIAVCLGVITVTSLNGKNPPVVPAVPMPSDSSPAPSSKPQSSEPESQPEESSQESEPAGDNSASSASSSASSETVKKPQTNWTEEQRKSRYFEEDLPILVNPTNKIPDGYQPNAVDLGNGYSLNKRAANAYTDMWNAAAKDGISLWLVSAYRTTEKQQSNFDAKVQEFKNKGLNDQEAYAATAKIIAVPGTSEHSLGLAVDVNSLEQSFENTKAYQWLVENCANYGFVLRYPKDKEEITEIIFEPWHYRYVGDNHAKIIMENKICLEEYLAGTY